MSFELSGVKYALRLESDGKVTGTWKGREPKLPEVRWVSVQELQAVGLRLGLGHKRVIRNALRALFFLGQEGSLGLQMRGRYSDQSFTLESLEAAVRHPEYERAFAAARSGGPKTAQLSATIIRHLRQELPRA